MDVLIVPTVENFELARKHLKKGTYHTTYFKNIHFIIKDDLLTVMYNGTDCRDYDYVWLSSYWGTRDLAYGLQLYLDEFNVKHTTVGRSGSKIVDHILFALH